MPAYRKIVPTQGKEFWESLDPENLKQVVEAVMAEVIKWENSYPILENADDEEYNRSNSDEVHHTSGSNGADAPLSSCDVRVSLPCFRDCQIFLLRGAILLEGQGMFSETGCSYLVKDEGRIGLCGSNTTIVVMEEGEQRGVCLKRTQEAREAILSKKSKPKCILM